jgi:hypothetical protein
LVQTDTLSAEQEKLAHPSDGQLGHAEAWKNRHTLLNGNFSLVPAHDISPLLASVLFADFTSLLSIRLAVTDHSDGWVMVLVTDSDPSDTVGYLSAESQKHISPCYSRWSQ